MSRANSMHGIYKSLARDLGAVAACVRCAIGLCFAGPSKASGGGFFGIKMAGYAP